MGRPLGGWTGPTANSTPFALNSIKIVRNQRPRRSTIHVRHRTSVRRLHDDIVVSEYGEGSPDGE